MYSMFKEVHPPTGVESAVVCNFLNSHEENLVVSTANELHVYKMNHNVGSFDNETDFKKELEKLPKSKLECLLTVKLFGKVISIQPIKADINTDYLLLSFQEAKLSLVQYDSETHDLKTVAFHNYEFDYLKDGRMQNSGNLPIVRCDPDSRCAAALLYGNKIAVFPFFKNETGITTGYSYIVDLRKLNEKVTSVVDFQFLYGFCEPTIALLYEPLPTWSGRIAIKKDSFNMVAISLNLEQQVNPSIWTVSGLPFDTFQLLPVPKPLGGLLVFATNSLMYFNQSCPPHAVSLNSIGSATTEFLLKNQEGVEFTLDCCQACFMKNDKVLISLKEGDLYVLTLLNDNTRTVRGFHFDKAATCVLTTCICVVEKEFLFLGSRLGNSLLLKYCEKHNEDGTVEEFMDSKLQDDFEDPDEIDLYGKESVKSKLTQYSFEVCDSMLNIGPCGHAVMGCAASLSEEFIDSDNPDIELVTTSGFNKSGAISVLQRSIRPQLVTTFKMSDCIDVWTAISKDESQNEDNLEGDYEDDGNYHSLMILSELKTTMILRAGIEISELDQSGFITQAPTIFAGNIGGNQYIVQVSTCGVRLLEGTRHLQHVALTHESPVVSCSLADPYLALLTESRQVIVISLKPLADGSSSRLVLGKPSVLKNVVALSLYQDDSGLFCSMTYAAPPCEIDNSDGDIEMLDEDELLYGSKTEKHDEPKRSSKEFHNSFKTSTHWLATCQDNGDLLIYSVPDFEIKFKSWNFVFGHQVLCNNLVNEQEAFEPVTQTVRELLMVGMGNKNLRPHLMAIINQELVIYEVYQYLTPSDTPILQIRLKKVVHSLSARDICYQIDKSDKEAHEKNLAKSKRKFLRQFENVSGLTGVFLCGACPHWIFMTYRGIIRLHPMVIDGPITFLTSFHNVNCPNGFLYLNSKCDLRISMLPTNLIYDSPWPVRRIPLRCTPYYVAYHSEDKFYAVVMSTSKPSDKLVKMVGDNEKEIETVERKGRFIYPTIEKFCLQFYSPVSWEPIPQCKLEFDEFERVTCMQLINFKSEGTVSGRKGYIVCGTTYSYTEDIPCKGRIIIMDIIEVVPEPGAPLTKNKLKIEYNREQKGGVSAVAGVHGLLVTAIGQKIYIWQMKDGDLKGVAFIDAQIYAHSIVVVKSLLFVGDVFKSVTLYRYQEEMKVLSVVSRDMQPREIYSLGFLVNKEDLYFMATDSDKNLLVYSYQPEMKESLGGQKLIQNACFNVGSHVNSMLRIICTPGLNANDNLFTKRQTTYICTLDGGVGCVVPLPEKMYRRLLMLQTILTWYTSHVALLNPKASRYSNCAPKQLSILDGVLISKFHELSFTEKKEVAGRIGTCLEQILSDLVNIELCTSHF